jgi:hypothetical protein
MNLRLASLFFISCAMLMASASAGLVTYTLTGGLIDGTLNGVAFSGANYTITAEADPSNFTSTTLIQGSSSFPTQYASAVSTMTIDGFAPFQITNANFGPVILDFTDAVPGIFFGGFGIVNFTTQDIDGFAAFGGLVGDALNGPGTISGNSVADTGITFTTTAGNLIIDTDVDGPPGVFTASGSPAVPEPTSMAIFGMGALGFAYRNRRKILK